MRAKTLIGNNIVGINQILPHKNKWAWDLYLRGCSNNWMPTEIPMQKDIEQWQGTQLSVSERLVVERCLGFFAGAESLVSNNLMLNICRYIQDGECRQFLMRQQNEEALHNLTVVYCCDSLNLNVKDIYEAYNNIPSVRDKDAFLLDASDNIPIDYGSWDTDDTRKVVTNIFTYYILCEGLLFYSGFAALLSLKRRNLMPGLGQQIEYTLRDEAVHVEFGVTLFNQIRQEEPSVFNKSFLDSLSDKLMEAVRLEQRFAHEMIPNGIVGLDEDKLMDYIKYIGNKRFEQIGLISPLAKTKNPFSWLSENIDLPKMKNFFESRVTDYKTAGLKDDW